MTSEFKELCRICLKKVDNMRYLRDSSIETLNLISMLSSIVNSEINIEEGLPSYMCPICEETLKISYEFQEISKKSHLAISEFIETLYVKLEDQKAIIGINLNSNISVKTEPARTVEEISVVFEENNINSSKNELIDFEDSNIHSSDDENVIEKEVKKKPKIKLSQHDPEEVMNIVKEIKLKFYEAKECLLCSFTGMNNRTLSLHMTRNHGELKDKWCRQCNKIEENIANHIKNVHLDDLKCPFCGKKSRSSSHLVEHLLYHSVDHQFTCEICKKSFISARYLKYHSKIHQIVCEICSATFLHKQTLLSHSKTHALFRCKLCDQTFSRENYDKHLCYKPDQRDKNECPREIQANTYCPNCNKDVEDIDKHMKTHHSKEIKGLCTYCGKQFKNQSYLTVHLRRHTKDTRYKCRYCEVATVTKAHLQEHERTHTGEKPYACKFCGKAFIQRSILSTHLKIHTGRTEQCHLCPKKFCRPSELRNHMRKHTGEKPYACSYCDRTFIQKSHLTEHLKTHTNDRPFKCHLCEKAFKQSGTLRGHINMHEGKNIYKCELCTYTCRKSYTLTLHVRQHQNTNNQEIHKCDICEEIFSSEELLTEHRSSNIHNSVNIESNKYEDIKLECTYLVST